jgi:hypothetical protein
MVFVHDIDPQAGPTKHQEVLNKIHGGSTSYNRLNKFLMTDPNKTYFSYRDESGEIKHASIPTSEVPTILGDLTTQLFRYTKWVKSTPGELIDPELSHINRPK